MELLTPLYMIQHPAEFVSAASDDALRNTYRCGMRGDLGKGEAVDTLLGLIYDKLAPNAGR